MSKCSYLYPSIHLERTEVVYDCAAQYSITECTDLTAVWAEVWVVCAGQDKTPGGTWAGAHGTAGLSWDTDQEGSMTPVSEEKQQKTIQRTIGV